MKIIFLGSLTCTHMLLSTPKGEPVKILSTSKSSETLLKMKYIDVNKNSPDLQNTYENTLKKLEVQFAGVDIVIHQNAIMDLVEKINKFTDEIKLSAKNLLEVVPEDLPESAVSPKPPRDGSTGKLFI